MIKLIASDMDGTLVSNDHAISEANSKAIKMAQNKGIEFIITTGRSYEDAHSQVAEAGIECNYLVKTVASCEMLKEKSFRACILIISS